VAVFDNVVREDLRFPPAATSTDSQSYIHPPEASIVAPVM
jgi:hypothetical protein